MNIQVISKELKGGAQLSVEDGKKMMIEGISGQPIHHDACIRHIRVLGCTILFSMMLCFRIKLKYLMCILFIGNLVVPTHIEKFF